MSKIGKFSLIFCIALPFLLQAQNDSLIPDSSLNETKEIKESTQSDIDIEKIKKAAKRMRKDANALKKKAEDLYELAENLEYTEGKDHVKVMKAKAKGMEEKAELMINKAEILYKKAEEYENKQEEKSEFNTNKDDFKEAIKKKALAIKDTVQLLTRESAKAFLNSFTGKKRSSRHRGYGGGLGPDLGIFLINIDPVKKLMPLPQFKNYRGVFSKMNGKFDNFLLIGGLGYGGLGNGLRLGGGGKGGSRTYSTIVDDTTFILKIHVGFGGFLAEKCFIKNKTNLFIGGILGAGGISVTPYNTVDDYDSDDFDSELNKLKAGFMLLEVHAGFTYTLTNWLHIGLDFSTPIFISPDGFKNNTNRSFTNGFMSLNPGFLIRIILGNIG